MCDRGADNFEVFCHLLQNRGAWVIRAAKLNRYVLAGGTEARMQLKDYLPRLKPLGQYTLSLRARPGQSARQARIEVRVGRIKIPRPCYASPWVRGLKQPPIAMNVIEVAEVHAPKSAAPIRWILFTSLPVKTFDDAWRIIGYYEMRWLVEEYHKALKTGCRTESRQLRTAGRLEALVGLTSVVAVRLLQLKSLARVHPEVPAQRLAYGCGCSNWLARNQDAFTILPLDSSIERSPCSAVSSAEPMTAIPAGSQSGEDGKN